jgi:hypothetical protein
MTEHARLFGALCFVTGDRNEAEEIMQDGVELPSLTRKWLEVRIL